MEAIVSMAAVPEGSPSSAMSSPARGRPPLSAEDMVALATTLLPSLLQDSLILEDFNGWVTEELMERVAGWVRAARPDLQELADACTHGVALALLSLSIPTRRSAGDPGLTVGKEVSDASFLSEEAVAAFYATLHSNCVVKTLHIGGAAFATPAAAAHLGRCLSRNSTLETLEIHSWWGETAWIAFSEALTSNASIQELRVFDSAHMAASLAAASHKLSALRSVKWSAWGGSVAGRTCTTTLSDMEGWSNMLKHNSTLTKLRLGLRLPPRGGLAAICEAMLTNTTLQHLTIDQPYPPEPAVNVEVADAEALAAMLRTNPTLKNLDIQDSGIMCNALAVDQGLSHNSSIEELGISLDPAGAHALMMLLAVERGASTATAASGSGLVLQRLRLGTGEGHGFPTAGALGDMLASNRTLLDLDLYKAPYSKEEWATTILPALANNQSMQGFHLGSCPGVDGELVYDALLELLESNTSIQYIKLVDTPLLWEGKAAAVEEALRANKEYRTVLKDVPTTLTNSCRLVLCGSPYAGKSTLLQTMMRRHHMHGHGKQRSSSYYQHMKERLATMASTCLFKQDDKERSRRTRGIDIRPLRIAELTVWMWDFAGQTEFHSLQDFIFPNGSSVHAASAFVFMFNPIWDDNSSSAGHGIKSEHQFEQEFSYWLRFICSNAKPRPSRASKPLVLVVITRKDRLKTERMRHDVKRAAKEWVRNMASKFEHLVRLEATNLFFVDATDEDDSELTTFVDHTVEALRTSIGDVAKVPTICDAVATALGGSGQQQLEPIISTNDFEGLCKSEAEKLSLQKLFRSTNVGDKVSKAVAAYLRDAGEVLYFPNLPFIVRNPRWFAHGILGYLVNIFSDHDHDGGYAPCCCVMKREVQRMRKEDTFQNGLVSKDSLTELLETALNIVGLNPRGVNTDQLIQLMEHLELCFAIGHDNKYLLPAIFEDEGDKAAKGERQRSWKVLTASSSSTRIFLSRRLECSDPIRTFLTPGFFPRLQVVLHNRAGEWAKDNNHHRCILEKNLCRLDFNGMEILVEHSGSSGYSVDIMVQSYQTREETIKFVESEIISRIRRFCASTKGCQGVTLAEAIIRPDCVSADEITLCRYRKSILVDDLKQLMAGTPNYMHNWGAIRAEDGTDIVRAAVHNTQALLDGEDQGQAGPSFFEGADVSDMPKLIGVRRQDVSSARDLVARMPKPWRAEPFRLHLECECRGGHHEVKDQPGRTFYVADQRYVIMQGAGAQVAGLVAAGLQVGGLFVPGLSVAGGVATGVGQSYQSTPIFPFDIETLSQRIKPRNGKVPTEALREEVEKDLQSSIEGSWLRAFLNPDVQAFATHFRLRKVQYTTPPMVGTTAWVCDRHWTEGRDKRFLRGV